MIEVCKHNTIKLKTGLYVRFFNLLLSQISDRSIPKRAATSS